MAKIRIREIEKLNAFKRPPIKPGEVFDPKKLQQEELFRNKEKLGAEGTINEFISNKPSKITQHFRDGHTIEYEMITQPDRSLSLNSNQAHYNVVLRAGNSTTPLILADPLQ